jgi:hypothetical protein
VRTPLALARDLRDELRRASSLGIAPPMSAGLPYLPSQRVEGLRDTPDVRVGGKSDSDSTELARTPS